MNTASDGLKTSAVAVALTLFPEFPQIREKNVGRPERVIFTVTMGLTLNAPFTVKVEQSGFEVPAAEYVTFTVPTALPTALWVATAFAACVARPLAPPQTACHEEAEFPGVTGHTRD